MRQQPQNPNQQAACGRRRVPGAPTGSCGKLGQHARTPEQLEVLQAIEEHARVQAGPDFVWRALASPSVRLCGTCAQPAQSHTACVQRRTLSVEVSSRCALGMGQCQSQSGPAAVRAAWMVAPEPGAPHLIRLLGTASSAEASEAAVEAAAPASLPDSLGLLAPTPDPSSVQPSLPQPDGRGVCSAAAQTNLSSHG